MKATTQRTFASACGRQVIPSKHEFKGSTFKVQAASLALEP